MGSVIGVSPGSSFATQTYPKITVTTSNPSYTTQGTRSLKQQVAFFQPAEKVLRLVTCLLKFLRERKDAGLCLLQFDIGFRQVSPVIAFGTDLRL
jgi:hypothetical protein